MVKKRKKTLKRTSKDCTKTGGKYTIICLIIIEWMNKTPLEAANYTTTLCKSFLCTVKLISLPDILMFCPLLYAKSKDSLEFK